MNYTDEYNDGTQPYQNGENDFTSDDPYSYKKALPQPPISYSQSVDDGFGHRSVKYLTSYSARIECLMKLVFFWRGASLPATPISQQRYNRQLPKHTSPTHHLKNRDLPKPNRHLPSSVESAASTFSSLFGVGRNAKKSNESGTQSKSIFSLLSESKPQASQQESYIDSSVSYNENFNYAYNSVDSTDEIMTLEERYDGDNNNLAYANARLGAVLPSVPSVPFYDKSSSLDYETHK